MRCSCTLWASPRHTQRWARGWDYSQEKLLHVLTACRAESASNLRVCFIHRTGKETSPLPSKFTGQTSELLSATQPQCWAGRASSRLQGSPGWREDQFSPFSHIGLLTAQQFTRVTWLAKVTNTPSAKVEGSTCSYKNKWLPQEKLRQKFFSDETKALRSLKSQECHCYTNAWKAGRYYVQRGMQVIKEVKEQISDIFSSLTEQNYNKSKNRDHFLPAWGNNTTTMEIRPGCLSWMNKVPRKRTQEHREEHRNPSRAGSVSWWRESVNCSKTLMKAGAPQTALRKQRKGLRHTKGKKSFPVRIESRSVWGKLSR